MSRSAPKYAAAAALAALTALCCACGVNTQDVTGPEPTEQTEMTAQPLDTEENAMENGLKLFIDGRGLDVSWEQNPAVKALEDAAKDELVVSMEPYGGFEQVGELGFGLPAGDVRIKTEPGDVVLYSGDRIVVFYGSNTWAYTKLGHIDADAEELRLLLANGPVELELAFEDAKK